jgi:hypothetical protein
MPVWAAYAAQTGIFWMFSPPLEGRGRGWGEV